MRHEQDYGTRGRRLSLYEEAARGPGWTSMGFDDAESRRAAAETARAARWAVERQEGVGPLEEDK